MPSYRTLAVFLAAVAVGCSSNPIQSFPYGESSTAGSVAAVNGTELYYETYGDGPPLLMLHGNEQSIAAMKKQIQHFSGLRKVIALDSRAHGKSARGDGALTYELLAADVAHLIRSLEISGIEVLGWSDGGIVALLLAMQEPTLVSKVAVVGAALSPGGAHAWAFPLVESHRSEILEQLERFPSGELQAQLDVVDLLLNHPNIDPERLRNIEAPVLVMAGDEDIIQNEHTLQIYQNIPKAQLCIFPGATHFVPVTHPEEFNAVVEKFLVSEFSRPLSKSMLTGN